MPAAPDHDPAVGEPASSTRRWLTARQRPWTTVAVVVASIAAVALALVWAGAFRGDASPVPQAAPTTSAAARTTAPPATTTPASPGVQVPPGDAPLEVKVPSLGVDAPVKTIAFKDGAINPPTMRDAYWIEAYGSPSVESDNTVYILGHSWDEGDAVFNALFDRASQTSRIFPGDTVIVTTAAGDVTYQVDTTNRYPRVDLANVEDVWRKVPGRLLLITCFQPNDGSAPKDNFVISAHAVS